MYVNIKIVFFDFLKNNFLDLRGLWFGRQYSFQLCEHQTKTSYSLFNKLV